MLQTIIFVTVACFLSIVRSEVTVMRVVQTIYEQSPKLRIRGSGFDADAADIVLELGVPSQPPLTTKDYILTKDYDLDGVVLKLLNNRTWADLSARVAPVALVLSAVKFKSHPNPNLNLLIEPVIVAQVLATPGVVASNIMIYQTNTNELRINGTGMTGAKKVDLYFNPPLYKEVAYEDVTRYPLYFTNSQIILRLRHGYSWKDAPGPLTVIGIDTGGGPVKLNGDLGVQVANVIADGATPVVTVDATASNQLIYDDDMTVIISGSRFNPAGTALRFANGLILNVNYTFISTTENEIKLQLVPGSRWRVNLENLPYPLTLLAVNTDAGFVNVGPANSGKGCNVAMVFERPNVYSSATKLFRSQSHELHVQGTGFPALTSGYTPELRFEPGLIQGVNYTLRVVSRTEIALTLVDGMAWRTRTGPLLVTYINARGDGAGWVEMPGAGVHVAEVVDDSAPNPSAGLEVFPTGVRVYQSALQGTIIVGGAGFQAGMSLTLDPPMVAGTDYKLKYINEHQLQLTLQSGKKWRPEPGPLVLKSMTLGGREYPLAGASGIQIAEVIADPVVSYSNAILHETQSKVLVISGKGFTDMASVKVYLRPTPLGSYKMIGVTENANRAQLLPGKSWLPTFMNLKDDDEDKRIALQVTSINTGAGDVEFPTPITVGYIVKDREAVICDDSCEFAFDGVCDEGSHSNDANDGDDYEHFQVSACVTGTDCTDCGGVDRIKPAGDCTNDCVYARDGVCDDPRGFGYCDLGTDCDDCGAVSAGNRTVNSIIRDTSATQRVYSDAAVIFLAATVLHPTGSAFRWSNKMRGDGVDYDLDLVDHSTLALRRTGSFEWERRFYQLPTVLYLEAVNDGLGAAKFRTLPGHGVGVATVFPRPSILPGGSKLFRTVSNELHLQGVGFPLSDSGFHVTLQFSPPLKLNHDYTVRVVSHTDLFILLKTGAAWSAQPGPLMVTAVNTAGGEENWIWFAGEGVRVADVHWDPDDGSLSRQMLTAGAAVLVLVLCGLCYRKTRGSNSGAAAAHPQPVEVRYQKVASSERDVELTARGASAGGMLGMGLVPASEVIVCADVEEGPDNADDSGAPIQEAVYSDQRHAEGTAYVPPAAESSA